MKKILSLLLLAGTLYVSAQTSLIPDMKFRRLDTQDGLSTSQINNIFKDSRGYVWIGTPYGLNRYDGYRVKTFYSNKRDTTTMRDNYTDRVFEAEDGRLWMRQGMNYCVYDPVTESFERNASHELAKMGLNTSVEWLHIDSKKRIWVKSFEEGIYCIHPGKKSDRKIVKIKSGYGMSEFHPDYGISTVAELGDKLVVATNMGELVCLNGEKGEVDWVDPHMRQNGGPENQEYRLFIDHHENYWCEALNYTFIYIKKENKWYSTVEGYFADHGIVGVPGPLMVWNLVVDKNDWLWLACDHDGLIVVDLKSKQWKQFLNNKFDETTISDNTLRTLMIPDDGSVWIGTYKNGVNQYVPGLSSLSTVELGDITTASEDKNGNYWLGTNDAGILVYNPKKGEVINHFTKDNSGLVSNIVVGSWPSRDGTIWFGSYNGGLTHCIPSATDPSHATVVNIQASENGQGLANNSVWALTEDRWGRMWFSTLGGGLQMLDPKTRKFTTWSTKNTQIPGDYLTSVGWNKKGWLMVGTSNNYSLVNPVTGKLANQILPDDPSIKTNITSTNYVIEDSRGLIWHGSSSGLLVHDPKTKFIKLLDMTSGLYGSGINSIIEDKKHNIWTVTDHGVSNIVPIPQDDGTWQFNIRSYNSRDGLQKAVYNQRSIFLTRDGKVLVGGQGGLDIIDPSKLEDTKSQERPVFSGLQIFDQNISVGEEYDGRVILDEALDVCRELSLRYNDQFTIQLATNEVSVGNSKRFAYKLEGFNENWVRTSELNPNVMFNSLRAGSYTLCVRIIKEDGSLGDVESQLDITIRPPLWRTRWMILLYMLAIAGMAFWWRRWFLRKQAEKMKLEQLRRETEKKQWMSEMRRKMDEEMKQFVSRESKVFVADENGVVDTHEETVYKERLDLVPLFRAVCDDFKAPDDKIISLSFFPFVDYLDIMGDRQQLTEMLQILLKNAATFSPSKSKIKVFLEKNDKNAVIRIADNGIGIPSEAMPHLFEEIVGDEDSPNLHKVFDIVMNHNGTIRAEENQGGGSVFVIELPDGIEIPVEDAVMMDDEETSDNSK